MYLQVINVPMESEKYLHENIIPDCGGIDDFLKYNNQTSFIETRSQNNSVLLGRNPGLNRSSNIMSRNSFADQIATHKLKN